jgi:biopolymer transport protein ExbD
MSSQKSSFDEDAGGIDLTPMLDVVFIMLIFFIVTATFIKEPGVEIERPDASMAEVKNAKIYVAIDAQNKVWVDKNEVEGTQIKDQIELLFAENPKSAVVIQADAESSIEMLHQVTKAVRELGIADVSVAAEKR